MIDENEGMKMANHYPALVVYDYLLTFCSEATFFWKPRRVNGAMILFLLNRYLTLAVQIIRCSPQPLSIQVRCLASG